MTRIYDVIVVGLGAMGSATAYRLAERGAKVLGLEAFTPAHELGSSGGLTRIIRLAYFEHVDYVPLLKAAWQMWPQIEEESGQKLLLQTGGVYVGRDGSTVLEGAVASARRHELDHELLGAEETRRRFPALELDDDMSTLHEPLAGILFAQKCIAAHLQLARRNNADLHFEERVTGWKSAGRTAGIIVTTDKGTYSADRLVLSVGAWLPKLAPRLRLPLTVERNALFWFEPRAKPEIFTPDKLPVWIMEVDNEHAYYGFPALRAEAPTITDSGIPAQGAKVARHHSGTPVDPDSVDRAATATDEQVVRGFMETYLPLANGNRLDSRVCMYTNTPDQHFIVDLLPDDERVVIASPCSGHGFKFSNVIGQICAELALDGWSSYEIGFLSINRFLPAYS